MTRQPDYEREGVRLYCGDCLEIMPELEDGSVDAVVTDPPYGIDFGRKPSALKPNATKYLSFDDSYDNWKQTIPQRVAMSLSVAKRGAVFCTYQRIWDLPVCDALGAVTTDCSSSRSSWGFNGLFPILLYGTSASLAHCKGARRTTFHDNSMRIAQVDHPCVKPIGWMLWLVDIAVWDGEVALDPFMGSGTTGVACVRLGRKFVGIEIERKYFDIAVKRIDAELDQGRLPYAQATDAQEEQQTLTFTPPAESV